MSLHLGNLSSLVRKEELERVFRRFGRCNLQLKDGFGFVVYDFPTNAEKALRVLRGKSICGEPITLSWSNKQPRPLQRFPRGNRVHETQRGRNTARGEDYVNRKLGSSRGRDYKIGFKHPDSDRRRLNSADVVDELTSYHQGNNIKEHIGEKQHNFREDLPPEDNNVQRNVMVDDRWGERVGLPSNEVGVEGGLEFDRYEPYHDDDDRRAEDGNQQISHSGSSLNLRKSQDKIGREKMGEGALNCSHDSKSRHTCYICGELGHKMRTCPRENASRRKKLSRFDQRHEDEINFTDKGEDNLKRIGSKSGVRLHLSRDAVLMRRHKRGGKASILRKHQRLLRSGHSDATKENQRGAWRKDYLEKKRSRRENGTLEGRAKKPRGPVSSPIHSDYTASRSLSHSESSKFVSRSGSLSNSRSVSSRTRSRSSRSRSGSTSRCSGSGTSKSRVRSRSSSPTSLSLSVSLGRPLPSSPNKLHMNQKRSLLDASCPDSKEVLVEQAQLGEWEAGSNNSKLENMTVPVENNNAIAPFIVGNTEKDHPPWSDGDNNCVLSKVSSEVKTSTSLLEKIDVTVDSLSPQSLGERKENSDALMPKRMMEPTKRPDSEALIVEDLSAPTQKPNPEASVRSFTANPTNISSEELYMVLKHYDLDQPAEIEKDLPVEVHFGTARLWPWEIIYYRRLRKGPISTENYARRIAQNQEFGIVDKYIRSSSGWGELGQENF